MWGRVGRGGQASAALQSEPARSTPTPDPLPTRGRGDAAQCRATQTDLNRPRRQRSGGLHTLYISPLKALAVDIARNLETPVAEMGLPIRIETRTGDTPASKRQRQRRDPPDILLTTPEQLALLLSTADGAYLFSAACAASCSTNCIRW